MARSETSLVAALLTQRLIDGVAEPLKASEYWKLVAQLDDLKELLGRSADELAVDLGIDAGTADRVARRLDQVTQVAFALDEAEQGGLRVVTSVDDEYPSVLAERLAAAAPPLLYVVGDTDLLHGGGLGVVGSRDVSPEAAEVAKDAGRLATAHGAAVLSGAAKGVDRLAMTAAVDAGGRAVGVLAESLTRMARDPDTRRAVTDGSLCLVTPYKPSAGFSVALAMARNKLVYALSTATLVVTTDHDKGGTWAGAVESIAQRYAPVLVWTGAGAGKGNRPLVERGGAAVDDLAGLFPLTRDTRDTRNIGDSRPTQLSLEL